MKPNFALSLSPESICLLHRAVGGWRLVGEVSPDSSALRTELAALRNKAIALAPDGLRSKVVIPNQQVRYLSIETVGMDVAEVRDAAYDALDGATPYAMDDLAFDVTLEGNVSHIAAVAYETLNEAESFALDHGFNPVCFVAIPKENAFLGEPYFGPAKAARQLLEDRQSVEQDGAAIVVIGDVVPTEGEATATPVANMFSGLHSASSTLEREQQDTRADAVESLHKTDLANADVIAPQLPSSDVATSAPEFVSRRHSASVSSARLFPQSPSVSAMASGFAETPAAPVTPNPDTFDTTPSIATAPPQSTNSAKEEASRLTTFGARDQAPDKTSSRPMGIAVSLALLVILIGVSTFAFGNLPTFVTELFDREARGTGDITAVQVSPPVLEEPLNDNVNASNDVETASLNTDLTDEDAAVLNALRAPVTEQKDQETASTIPESFLSKYAVTGIWPLAPDVPSPPPLVNIDDLYVTSIDPIEPAFDAVALPQLEKTNRDTAIDTPSSPAAAGTAFNLDARGLVVGTAEGTLSPDGVKIFAGAPPVRPTTLPTRAAQSQTKALGPERASLAAFRPKLRPDDIVETTERATLDGLIRFELEQIRPPLRPASTGEASASGASLVPLGSAAAPLSEQNTDTSGSTTERLAAVATLRPDIRPSNFSQIVARAQKTSAAAPASVASIAPRVVVKPSIPTTASVAREATVRNAINMRKVNLIGVYGTPSQRRALIRLANGRYKKVQVGDRIDGGRISVIGEGELRYQKSGRNIILKMPKS